MVLESGGRGEGRSGARRRVEQGPGEPQLQTTLQAGVPDPAVGPPNSSHGRAAWESRAEAGQAQRRRGRRGERRARVLLGPAPPPAHHRLPAGPDPLRHQVRPSPHRAHGHGADHLERPSHTLRLERRTGRVQGSEGLEALLLEALDAGVAGPADAAQGQTTSDHEADGGQGGQQCPLLLLTTLTSLHLDVDFRLHVDYWVDHDGGKRSRRLSMGWC